MIRKLDKEIMNARKRKEKETKKLREKVVETEVLQ